MSLEIPERDWKVLKELHGPAAERFLKRVLDELRSMTTPADGDYYAAFERIRQTTKDGQKELTQLFDEQRRSQAVFCLLRLRRLELLTDEEWSRFSPETRAVVFR